MAAPSISAAVAPVVPVVVVYAGQTTGNVSGAVKFRAPQKARLIRVAASARAKGGTITTFTVDVKKGGSSVLSSAIDLAAPAAGTYTEGTLAKANANDLGVAVAKEDEITVDVALAGTSPTANDISVELAFVPEI